MRERTIAEALRSIREQTGLGQKRLADKLAVTKPVVSRCERKGSNPSWATITRFLGACDASVTDLAYQVEGTPTRVMVANGDEVLAGEIETTDDGATMTLAGQVVMQASNSVELLERLPSEVSVYGLIR